MRDHVMCVLVNMNTVVCTHVHLGHDRKNIMYFVFWIGEMCVRMWMLPLRDNEWMGIAVVVFGSCRGSATVKLMMFLTSPYIVDLKS